MSDLSVTVVESRDHEGKPYTIRFRLVGTRRVGR